MTGQDQINDGAVVMKVESPIYSAEDRRRLRFDIEEVLAGTRERSATRKRLVVDCASTRWFGPPILDELILTQQRLAERGGDLLLVISESSKIGRILKAARVDRFKTFASVQSALASSGQSVPAAA